MGILTEKQRKLIPANEFGLPGQRAYPVPDKAHARVAKSRASEMYNKGRLSASQKAQIDRKADKKLHKSGGRSR